MRGKSVFFLLVAASLHAVHAKPFWASWDWRGPGDAPKACAVFTKAESNPNYYSPQELKTLAEAFESGGNQKVKSIIGSPVTKENNEIIEFEITPKVSRLRNSEPMKNALIVSGLQSHPCAQKIGMAVMKKALTICDTKADDLICKMKINLILLANPDGFSQYDAGKPDEKYNFWNRQTSGTCQGININRNFAETFKANAKCDPAFPGENAAEAKETKFLSDRVGKTVPDQIFSIVSNPANKDKIKLLTPFLSKPETVFNEKWHNDKAAEFKKKYSAGETGSFNSNNPMYGTFIDYFVKKYPGKYGFQLECYGEGEDAEADKIADGLLEAIKLAAPLKEPPNKPTTKKPHGTTKKPHDNTNKPHGSTNRPRPTRPSSPENQKKAFDIVQDSDLNDYVSENTFDDAAAYVQDILYPKFEIREYSPIQSSKGKQFPVIKVMPYREKRVKNHHHRHRYSFVVVGGNELTLSLAAKIGEVKGDMRQHIYNAIPIINPDKMNGKTKNSQEDASKKCNDKAGIHILSNFPTSFTPGTDPCDPKYAGKQKSQAPETKFIEMFIDEHKDASVFINFIYDDDSCPEATLYHNAPYPDYFDDFKKGYDAEFASKGTVTLKKEDHPGNFVRHFDNLFGYKRVFSFCAPKKGNMNVDQLTSKILAGFERMPMDKFN